MRDDDVAQSADSAESGTAPPSVASDKPAVFKGLAKFGIGQSVRHRKFGFQGVIFDVDPEFANTEEWYNAIPPDVRPRKDQPFYHLFAVSPADQSPYIAYVSEQNLLPLPSDEEVAHPQLEDYFEGRSGSIWVVPRDRIQ